MISLGIRLANERFCFLSSSDFFQNQLLRKNPSGKHDLPHVLSGLIWVQIVCKGISRRHNIVGKEYIRTFDLNAGSLGSYKAF